MERHPGEYLLREMNNAGMSRKELAIRTGVTEKHICTVINQEKGLSTLFAKKLGYVFKDTAYWLDLQTKFDTDQLHIKEENNISQEEIKILKPLQEIMSYFIQSGYMHNNCGEPSKVMQLRDLLQISDLTLIPKITYNAAYRAQLNTNIKIDPYVLFAWQRLCEKETEKQLEVIDTSINTDLLRNSLTDLKKTMFGNINKGIEEIQKILATCGIAFQVVKNFKGAPVQGFIKEVSNNRLILCLTIRGKRADRFWFTFFHEIGHILKGDYKNRFVDFDSIDGTAEILADNFAMDTLIPIDQYGEFIKQEDCTSWDRIVSFAQKVSVKPFIVIGRLQNDNFLDWTDYSDKVEKYEWA